MRLFGFLGVVSLFFVQFPVASAQAAQLTLTRLYLNRQQAGLTTGEQFELFFKPATTLTGSTNKVILTFPNNAANNTKWCRTAGTLTLTAITEPTPTIVTAESATGLLGTITGACTQTPDTFTISAVGALQNSTKYGVRIVANTAVMGTGDAAASIKYVVDTQQVSTPTDTYTGATALVASDQYTVSATVDPNLSVTLSATTLNLGTLSATGNGVSYQGVTSSVTTNAKNGYVSVVSYSGTFSNGTDNIADAGGTVTTGTSSFGAATSKASQSIAADSTSPACSTTVQTQSASANSTALSTAGKQFASAAAAASADATTLCFLAGISATQAPGSYSTTVTLVTTARF